LTLVRWAQARRPLPSLLLWGSLLGLLAVIEAATRSGSVRRSILVPPTELGQTLLEILTTGRIPSPYLARTDVCLPGRPGLFADGLRGQF